MILALNNLIKYLTYLNTYTRSVISKIDWTKILLSKYLV